MGASSRKNVSSDRLFYKIGEISELLELEAYVLRYWETEFPFLKPRKNKAGQRVYTRKDLEIILQIKNLLYMEGYTIAGVRKKFSESAPVKNTVSIKTVHEIKKKLKEILNILK